MKRTKKLTLCALCTALTVILLLLGSFVEVLDLTMAGVGCCFVIFMHLELGGIYPFFLWGASATLSLLLLPSGGAGLFFALIGLYPLLKAMLERLPRTVEWVLKILICLLILTAYVLLARFVFLLPDAVLSGFLLPVFLLVATLAFIAFDIALSRLIVFYGIKIRPRIAHLLK